MCTHIHVSRSPHCAIDNHTGDASRRASPDAGHTPACTIWLSVGVPYLTALRGGPKPDGDCRVPVVLTLPCVPNRTSVSHGEPRYPSCPRWSALDRCPDERLNAVAYALLGSLTQSGPACLGLVPHPVELCDTRSDAPGQTWHCGVSGNGTPLAS